MEIKSEYYLKNKKRPQDLMELSSLLDRAFSALLGNSAPAQTFRGVTAEPPLLHFQIGYSKESENLSY